MPDQAGNTYAVRGFKDANFNGEIFRASEGRTDDLPVRTVNDQISSFALVFDNVDADDFQDLQAHPERIRFWCFRDGKRQGDLFDLSGAFRWVGNVYGIPYVGDEANDQISSWEFVISPADPIRLLNIRAARKAKQGQTDAAADAAKAAAEQADRDAQRQRDAADRQRRRDEEKQRFQDRIERQKDELERRRQLAELQRQQQELLDQAADDGLYEDDGGDVFGGLFGGGGGGLFGGGNLGSNPFGGGIFDFFGMTGDLSGGTSGNETLPLLRD